MPLYKTPGVYVEETDTGGHLIQPVGTSTAGFVGAAPDPAAHLDEAFAVNNWAQFVREYARNATTSTNLSNAVYGFFLNGGSRCYVVNTKAGTSISAKDKGVKLLEKIDEVAIIAAPGMTDTASYNALLDSAELMQDRIAVLDGPQSVDDVGSLAPGDDGGAAPPAAPAGGGGSTPKAKAAAANLRPRESKDGYGAFYFPWLLVNDPITGADDPVPVPPSGHIAGIYARTDAKRGVQKAPANETVRGAVSVTQVLSRSEQDVLNPAGVNCIRYFSREGVLVWGARTLASESSSFRYVNTRRLFNMVEESIAESTRWVVFEPNDRSLWQQIELNCRSFLKMLHSQGVFAGPVEKAFFVKCDDETNPPEAIELGYVTTVIGMATVRPAEFVVFQIGQSQAGTTLTAA